MREEATKELTEIKERLERLFDEKEITGFYLMVDRGFEDYEQMVQINLLQMCAIYRTMLDVIAYEKGYTREEARKFIDALEEVSAMRRAAGTLEEVMGKGEDDERGKTKKS